MGVCSGERVIDVPDLGEDSLVFDRIATPCHPSGCSLYSGVKQFAWQSRCFWFFGVKFCGTDVGLVDLAGRADANSLEPKSTDLGSRSFAPLHARDIIDRPGRMRVLARVCSCLARSLRAL